MQGLLEKAKSFLKASYTGTLIALFVLIVSVQSCRNINMSNELAAKDVQTDVQVYPKNVSAHAGSNQKLFAMVCRTWVKIYNSGDTGYIDELSYRASGSFSTILSKEGEEETFPFESSRRHTLAGNKRPLLVNYIEALPELLALEQVHVWFENNVPHMDKLAASYLDLEFDSSFSDMLTVEEFAEVILFNPQKDMRVLSKTDVFFNRLTSSVRLPVWFAEYSEYGSRSKPLPYDFIEIEEDDKLTIIVDYVLLLSTPYNISGEMPISSPASEIDYRFTLSDGQKIKFANDECHGAYYPAYRPVNLPTLPLGTGGSQ